MKKRFCRGPSFFVSDGKKDQAFVHLELSILPGRNPELKQKVSRALLTELKEAFPETASKKVCSFTVEIRELDGECYSKEMTGE